MKKLVERIKLQVEGFKFGLKYGKELTKESPFMPLGEIQARAVLKWADHLIDTGRSYHIKNKDKLELLRSQLKQIDIQRNVSAF